MKRYLILIVLLLFFLSACGGRDQAGWQDVPQLQHGDGANSGQKASPKQPDQADTVLPHYQSPDGRPEVAPQVSVDGASPDLESSEPGGNSATVAVVQPQTVSTEPAERPPIDLSVGPSEGGQIMILMYHNIGDEEEEWVRTPENFRRDLEILHMKGYRPIRLMDYVRGYIDTPAGLTPYVITFDDTLPNNFRLLEDGSVDPTSAVGILMDFAKDYPDFTPHATFFAYGPVPFRVEGEEVQKVNFMIENGMDIGNHSYDHAQFDLLDKDELQASIGMQANYLKTILPEGYEVRSLALPYGLRPEDPEIEAYVYKGEYDGIPYENEAVLNVGWNPAYSPFHNKFDPQDLNRIRGSETNVGGIGLYDWLDYFDLNPDQRFVSDGDPLTISAPADWREVIPDKEGYFMNFY